jgi:hypothetical protein
VLLLLFHQTDQQAEAELANLAKSHLQGLGVPVELFAAGAGLREKVGKKAEAQEYLVSVKRHLSIATLGVALNGLRELERERGMPTLLLADYVSPPLAEKLRGQGQAFMDAAGNAFVQQPGMLIWVVGRKPLLSVAPAAAGRADTPVGLKILFALLCEPALANATHREIAARAGVALGGVPAAFQDLQEQGHLAVLGKQRRLQTSRRLLDAWAQAYARRLRPKTLKGLYTTPLFDDWEQWSLPASEGLWGGESAAQLLTQYLRPGILTIYTHRLPPLFMAKQRMSKAPDGAAERVVEWREPFWGAVGTLRPADLRADVVPPVLVYADLLATGESRCIETANLLYEQYLAKTFPQA